MSPTTIYLSLVVAVGILIQNYLSRRAYKKAKLLPHIPLVRFEDNNTQERYITSTKDVMHKGYIQYNKMGQAFRIRNPVDEGSPQVIMAKKYLDEVMNASEDKLSFPLYSIQV
ncbi:hypothetical protein HYALB_00010834 [Hymenoscyphus albidus]|uniref:Uncharacterized protein n=1 Tax=Hymenoscyphus albidus TaxID=595503 RepID=A0A9N9LH63_9HELO|nr:hypothetical protein HYALB_00010834 [Hymenoscyphus albidus]